MSADSSLSIDLPLSPAFTSTAPRAITDPDRAIIRLFDEHAVSVLRYLRGLGLDPAAAEDVLQDTFIALHKHIVLDRPQTNIAGWIFQVAQNLARREQRRRTRGVVTAPWEGAPERRLVDRAPTPEDRVLERENGLRLRAAVAALPARDRHCLRLRADGLRYRDIATTLGMSLGAVAKSVARSVSHLARVLEG